MLTSADVHVGSTHSRCSGGSKWNYDIGVSRAQGMWRVSEGEANRLPSKVHTQAQSGPIPGDVFKKTQTLGTGLSRTRTPGHHGVH